MIREPASCSGNRIGCRVVRLWGTGDVAEQFHDLLRGLRPRHRRTVHLFEGVDEVFRVEGDVGLAEGRAAPRVKRRIPLLVLLSEAHHRHIAVFNQRFGPDRVHLGGLVIAPEVAGLFA